MKSTYHSYQLANLLPYPSKHNSLPSTPTPISGWNWVELTFKYALFLKNITCSFYFLPGSTCNHSYSELKSSENDGEQSSVVIQQNLFIYKLLSPIEHVNEFRLQITNHCFCLCWLLEELTPHMGPAYDWRKLPVQELESKNGRGSANQYNQEWDRSVELKHAW